MQQYCRCLLPGLNDNGAVALLKSRGGFIFKSSGSRTSSQLLSERGTVLMFFLCMGRIVSLLPNLERSRRLQMPSLNFGGAGVLGYVLALFFTVNPNI